MQTSFSSLSLKGVEVKATAPAENSGLEEKPMKKKVSESELLTVVNGMEPVFLDEVPGGGYICPVCGGMTLEKQGDDWICPGCHARKKVHELFIEHMSEDTQPGTNLFTQLAKVYDLDITWDEGPDERTKELISSAKDLAERNRMNAFTAGRELDYFRTITDRTDCRDIKTGFTFFDDEEGFFCGGLHEGLYVIGAVSALGKTTFCYQLAEQISENGTPVIFFTLEQSKEELLAKGIARRTFEIGGRAYAKDVLHVLNGNRYKNYSAKERAIITEAISETAKSDERMMIVEGTQKGKRIGLPEISDLIRSAQRYWGQAPVVFLDYLQILPPSSPYASDKQNNDDSITKLKNISRIFHTPVVVISSFNRDSYNEPVSMRAFKETGAIEYSSDILLALQLHGMDDEPETKESGGRPAMVRKLIDKCDEAKREKAAVRVQLKVLKSKNGNTFSASLDFIHAYCHFAEIEEVKQQKNITRF